MKFLDLSKPGVFLFTWMQKDLDGSKEEKL